MGWARIGGMKGAMILAVLLSSFYVGATKIIMIQLKDLEDFYSNSDKIATAVASNQDYTHYTQSLKNLENRTNLLGN